MEIFKPIIELKNMKFRQVFNIFNKIIADNTSCSIRNCYKLSLNDVERIDACI